MSVSLVGSIGKATRVTSGTSITGVYGQSPTSGNLLIAVLDGACSTAASNAFTAATGWTSLVGPVKNTTGAGTSHTIAQAFWKRASGGDAAPVFSFTIGATFGVDCTIFELNGANTTNPLGISGTYSSSGSGTGTATVTFSQTTGPNFFPSLNSFAISVMVQEAASATLTWTESGTGWTSAQKYPTSGASVANAQINYQVGPSSSAALVDSGHWSTDTTAYGSGLTFTVVENWPAISTLIDNLSTNTLSTTWSGSYGTVTWSPGQVAIQTDTSYSSGFEAAATTIFNLDNSSLYVKLVPYQASSSEVMLQIFDTNSNAWQFGYNGGNLQGAIQYPQATTTQIGEVTYDPVNHAFIRIREASGTVYFDTAPDGVTWTNQWSTSTEPISGNALSVSVFAGDYGTDPTGTSYVSNINTAGATITSSGTLSITPTFSTTRIHGHGRSATLAESPTFAASRTRGRVRTATSTQTPTFTAVHVRGRVRTATLAESPTFSAGRTRGRVRSALQSVLPSFVATRIHGHGRHATLTETPTFSATKLHGHPRSATLAESPTFSATRIHGHGRHATLAESPTFSASRTRGRVRSSALSPTPAFSAGRTRGRVRTAIKAITPTFTAGRVRGRVRSALQAISPVFDAVAHVATGVVIYRSAALSVIPSFVSNRIHGHNRGASSTQTPTFSAGRKRGRVRSASSFPEPTFTAGRSHGMHRGATLGVIPTLLATGIVHGTTYVSHTASIAVACNAESSMVSTLTISCVAGAPYQTGMRQLTTDHWNYMYPSE